MTSIMGHCFLMGSTEGLFHGFCVKTNRVGLWGGGKSDKIITSTVFFHDIMTLLPWDTY